MSAARSWPAIPEEHRWVLEMIEEQLETTKQTPEELSARANEFRRQAQETDIRGFREAALALAERYDQAAAARLAST